MNECIFLTGAGAGIGRATARLFAAEGWFIGAADQDAQALEALRQPALLEVCRKLSLSTAQLMRKTSPESKFQCR